jgi:hypothetical protein
MSNHFCNNFGQKLNRIMKTVGFGCAGPTNLWFFCWLRLQRCRPDGAPKNVELLNGLHGYMGHTGCCVLRIACGRPSWASRKGEPCPNGSEPNPSCGSPLLGFARDCSALLAFCTGSFFYAKRALPGTMESMFFTERRRKIRRFPSPSVAFRRFPSLRVREVFL